MGLLFMSLWLLNRDTISTYCLAQDEPHRIAKQSTKYIPKSCTVSIRKSNQFLGAIKGQFVHNCMVVGCQTSTMKSCNLSKIFDSCAILCSCTHTFKPLCLIIALLQLHHTATPSSSPSAFPSLAPSASGSPSNSAMPSEVSSSTFVMLYVRI